jgi:hypothetical protein
MDAKEFMNLQVKLIDAQETMIKEQRVTIDSLYAIVGFLVDDPSEKVIADAKKLVANRIARKEKESI